MTIHMIRVATLVVMVTVTAATALAQISHGGDMASVAHARGVRSHVPLER